MSLIDLTAGSLERLKSHGIAENARRSVSSIGDSSDLHSPATSRLKKTGLF